MLNGMGFILWFFGFWNVLSRISGIYPNDKLEIIMTNILVSIYRNNNNNKDKRNDINGAEIVHPFIVSNNLIRCSSYVDTSGTRQAGKLATFFAHTYPIWIFNEKMSSRR